MHPARKRLDFVFDCRISLEYAMAAVNETTVNRGIVRVLLQKLPSACWYPYPPEVADPLGKSKASARQFPERGLLQKGYRPLPRAEWPGTWIRSLAITPWTSFLDRMS
jgi:hypothetical protein